MGEGLKAGKGEGELVSHSSTRVDLPFNTSNSYAYPKQNRVISPQISPNCLTLRELRITKHLLHFFVLKNGSEKLFSLSIKQLQKNFAINLHSPNTCYMFVPAIRETPTATVLYILSTIEHESFK
jgi:hypothetical protein